MTADRNFAFTAWLGDRPPGSDKFRSTMSRICRRYAEIGKAPGVATRGRSVATRKSQGKVEVATKEGNDESLNRKCLLMASPDSILLPILQAGRKPRQKPCMAWTGCEDRVILFWLDSQPLFKPVSGLRVGIRQEAWVIS